MSPRLGVAVVAVLAVDAALLGLTELAWLTLTTGGGAWVPASVAAALVTTPLLVRLADRVVPRGFGPLAPLVSWTAAVLVVGAWSPSGVGTLPADYRALLLLAAGLLPGLLAVVWRPAPPAEAPADRVQGTSATDRSS